MTRKPLWALAAGALLGVVLLSVPALAHATLVSTSPASGAELDRSPASVSATFDGPVRLVSGALRVYDGTGAQLATGTGRHADDGRTAVLPLPSLRDGAYVFTWRVISADGHPVAGGITFHVGPARDVDASLLSDLLQRQRGSATVAAVAVGVDLAGYAAGALLVGGLVGMTVLGLPRRRYLVVGAAAVLAATALAGVVLEVPQALGTSLGGVLGEPSLLADGVRTQEGALGIAQAVLALVVAGLLVRLRDWPRSRWVLVGTACAAVGVDALTGHSVAGTAVPFWVIVDAAHLLAALGWVGALALLFLCLRRRDDDLVDQVGRFSRWAAGAVAVLVATGTAQALREVGGWTPLVDTTYGHVLLLKLLLVELMLVGAVASRAEVRRRRTDGRALLSSVKLEAIVGVVVIAVTSVLVGTAPGNAYDSPATVTSIDFDRALALRVTAEPARHGRVRLRIVVHRHEGGHDHENPVPLGVRSLTVRMSLPSRDIGPIPVPLTRVEPGVYAAERLDVPVAGEWQIEGSVVVSGTDQATLLVRIAFR